MYYFKIIKRIFFLKAPEPNFVILGAQKSGTTTLHYLLDKHPDIFMSKPEKEPRYFADLKHIKKYWIARGRSIKSKKQLLKKYMLVHYDDQKIFGESSTDYTIENVSRENKCPDNMKMVRANMKFVYIIRNPFSRIISNYAHSFYKGYTKDDLNVWIRKDDRPILTSLYFYQLSEYLKYFPLDQFKIIIFEEFIDAPLVTFNDIIKFLNLDPFHVEYVKQFNKTHDNSNLKINDLGFSKENHSFLLNKIEKDLDQLAKVLNRSFDFWDLSEKRWCK